MNVRSRGKDKTTASPFSNRHALNPWGCLAASWNHMADMNTQVATTGV